MDRACSTNGKKRNACRIFVGKPEGKKSLARPNVCGWTILRLILEREDGMVWIGLIWLRIETSVRFL
jgi:hypothetical protein